MVLARKKYLTKKQETDPGDFIGPGVEVPD
jgi:hypothetical protein